MLTITQRITFNETKRSSEYLIHYEGWNTQHDEVVPRLRLLEVHDRY
jgi:hypothetical protein